MGMVRFFWRALSMLAFFLAILGAALPLLPTVPFLLVSAWVASKGSPAFEQWLLYHPRFGAPVRAWRNQPSQQMAGHGPYYRQSDSAFVYCVAPLAGNYRGGHSSGGLIWLWLREEY